MKKAKVNLVGEKIITNEKFEGGEGITGYVINMVEEGKLKAYGVYFPETEKVKINLHHLNFFEDDIKILSDKKGSYLEKKEFDIIEKEIEEDLLPIYDYFREQNLTDFLEKTQNIDKFKKDIKNKKSTIKKRGLENKKDLKNIKSLETNITKLENLKIEDIDDDISKVTAQIKKIKKVKEVINTEKYIVIKTEGTRYTGHELKDEDFGDYMIFIPKNLDEDVKAVNYKKIYSGYSNPCISTGSICKGVSFGRRLSMLREEKDIVGVILATINFLEEPNYDGPYVSEKSFKNSMRDVTYHPKNIEDYLLSSFYDKQ